MGTHNNALFMEEGVAVAATLKRFKPKPSASYGLQATVSGKVGDGFIVQLMYSTRSGTKFTMIKWLDAIVDRSRDGKFRITIFAKEFKGRDSGTFYPLLLPAAHVNAVCDAGRLLNLLQDGRHVRSFLPCFRLQAWPGFPSAYRS